MRLDDTIDKETYDEKYYDLTTSMAKLQDDGVALQNSTDKETAIKNRITSFRRVLEQNEVLTEFDRYVFESIVDKVIVGGIDDDGNKDPSLLTFIYKTGFTNSIDSNNHKPERKAYERKDIPANLCSDTMNEGENLCSHGRDDTRGDGSFIVQTKINQINRSQN